MNETGALIIRIQYRIKIRIPGEFITAAFHLSPFCGILIPGQRIDHRSDASSIPGIPIVDAIAIRRALIGLIRVPAGNFIRPFKCWKPAFGRIPVPCTPVPDDPVPQGDNIGMALIWFSVARHTPAIPLIPLHFIPIPMADPGRGRRPEKGDARQR